MKTVMLLGRKDLSDFETSFTTGSSQKMAKSYCSHSYKVKKTEELDNFEET